MKLMLDDKDIQKLKETLTTKEDLEKFATKEDLRQFSIQALETFVTKQEFKEAISFLATKEDLSNLLTAIDAYAKKVDTYAQEMLMLAHKVDRHEKWLHQIAEKLEIKLEY